MNYNFHNCWYGGNWQVPLIRFTNIICSEIRANQLWFQWFTSHSVIVSLSYRIELCLLQSYKYRYWLHSKSSVQYGFTLFDAPHTWRILVRSQDMTRRKYNFCFVFKCPLSNKDITLWLQRNLAAFFKVQYFDNLVQDTGPMPMMAKCKIEDKIERKWLPGVWDGWKCGITGTFLRKYWKYFYREFTFSSVVANWTIKVSS